MPGVQPEISDLFDHASRNIDMISQNSSSTLTDDRLETPSNGCDESLRTSPRGGGRCLTCGQLPERLRTDRLTGLLDRDGWENAVARAHKQVRRRAATMALLIIDLDWFKQINDRFGHPAGDTVLQSVAAVLQRCTRAIDVVGRYGGHGGDEFLILTPDTDLAGALTLARRICVEINTLVTRARNAYGQPVAISKLTASVGVAVQCPQDHLVPAELIRCADAALLRAKHSGRGMVCVSSLPKTSSLES
ncbi:GGDEF domain-containing protein [Crossiella sp. SN42]|uniref:GGDEF domain-containing protein n=1 Tax=Crossiella sp. SN42 TaxID=2944808 RepID=UPI00207C8EE7|nr:GGDEF domain-containing protein [Crossiella sp. SN42]MCO1580477.1 GGDEF domain-containing protein [Crossiella sp. SN42]